jgi:2-polyprenyl-3-methyl-5-hydroxy-6-metoxy-1,4-benzoquinol methylase
LIEDTPCAVCESRGTFRDFVGGLERCTACGFVAYRRAAAEDIERLYDEAYFTGAEYPDYLGQEHALRRSMRRHLGQMRSSAEFGGSLLEVGCAYGLFLDEARGSYDRVTGVDVAEAPVRYAREKLGLDARLGDVRELEFPPASFDVVCMWDTLEHLPAPDSFLVRARELLRPGGTLFITTGDIGSLNARVRGSGWRQIHPPSHLNYFSRRTLSALVRRLGFEVIGIQTAAYYHTLYNVLASMRMRPGVLAVAAGFALKVLGERFSRRIGFWLDLRDIMFVAARRV